MMCIGRCVSCRELFCVVVKLMSEFWLFRLEWTIILEFLNFLILSVIFWITPARFGLCGLCFLFGVFCVLCWLFWGFWWLFWFFCLVFFLFFVFLFSFFCVFLCFCSFCVFVHFCCVLWDIVLFCCGTFYCFYFFVRV